MIQANNFGVEWIKVFLPFECEIHWLRPRYSTQEFHKNKSFKVLLINSEPSAWCISESELYEIAEKFDLIIGKKIFDGITNCVALPFGGTFIKDTQTKELGVSNLLSMGSHGSLLPGHIFRVAIATRLLGINSDFYDVYKGSSFDTHIYKLNSQLHPFLSALKIYPYESKDQLYKKTHNIAIENSSEYNYFTEKLIDCFRTLTVPIYWGCSNISDHFDIRGMIIIDNIEDISQIIKDITLEDYLNRVPFLLKNYDLSKNYWDVLKNINHTILDFKKKINNIQ